MPSSTLPPKSDVAGAAGVARKPGESPFHVKGNVYLGTKQFFAQKVEGGLDALYRSIDDPALLEFIQQRFVAVAWYDVLPAVALIRAEARALGLGTKRYLQLRTAYQAEQDLVGVYRMVLKLASVELVALKMPRLFSQVFDFGSSDARVVGVGHVEGAVLDFPVSLYDWFSVSFEVYARAALKKSGAREAAVTTRRTKSTAAAAGSGAEPLTSLLIDMRWSA
jgi:hypothetical protein